MDQFTKVFNSYSLRKMPSSYFFFLFLFLFSLFFFFNFYFIGGALMVLQSILKSPINLIVRGSINYYFVSENSPTSVHILEQGDYNYVNFFVCIFTTTRQYCREDVHVSLLKTGWRIRVSFYMLKRFTPPKPQQNRLNEWVIVADDSSNRKKVMGKV